MRLLRRVDGKSLIALSAAVLLCGTAIASPPQSWRGQFIFQGQDGYDGGGTPDTGNPIILSFTLSLTDTGCRLSQEGFQTDETDLCRVLPRADGIDIVFKSYGDGSLVNQYGVAVYKPGDRLFSLTAVKGGSIITHWDALQPDFVKAKSGRYFSPTP